MQSSRTRRVTVRGDNFSVRAKRCVVTRTAPDRGAHPLPTDPARYSRSNDAAHANGPRVKVQCVYPTRSGADRAGGARQQRHGPVRITFDNTARTAVSRDDGFMEAKTAGSPTDDRGSRRQGVIDSFVRYFGDGAAIPLEYIGRTGWKRSDARLLRRRPWPRAWLNFGATQRAPVGRIPLAGTETRRCGTAIWMAR